jgi:succinate dehydrogenase / fumarate reductase flavoprotein subunit
VVRRLAELVAGVRPGSPRGADPRSSRELPLHLLLLPQGLLPLVRGLAAGCAVGPLGGNRRTGETFLLVFQNLHRYAMYFAVLFVVHPLVRRVVASSTRAGIGIGVGSIILTLNAILIARYTFGCHSFRHMIGGRTDCMSCGKSTLQYGAWKQASWFNERHMEFAWVSLVWVMVADLYVRLLSMGVITTSTPGDLAMLDVSEIQTIDHDVMVVGAGGAGPRAAIECSAQKLSTGVISKSLLGKAHTVMAEGGMAAAMGNVDARDNWKVHFRDTMRGGKFLNVWRMAELHAQQAPERVRELEEWGAVFDRTKEGLISQRNFGGHRYPRLAHVGDRTGLELIRSLQDHGVHQGIDFHMECTALELLKDGDRIAGLLAYWRETGRFVIFRCKAVILATGGGGKAWPVTSNSWEYTGDGTAMAYDAGAELMDVEFTQFHPTGMVWPLSVRGILVTEGVRGDGGILKNNKGERFMFNYISERFAPETADTVEEADRWLEGRQDARRPPELLTRDEVARAITAEVQGRARLAARRRVPRHRVAPPGRLHQAQAAVDVPPVQGAGRGRHHQGADGGRPDAPLLHGRSARRRRHAAVDRCRACSRPASAPRDCTAPTGSAATRCRT